MTIARYRFAEIARDETVDRCRALHAARQAWHIHALDPDCRFNQRPGQHCFVIEATHERQTWCAFSDDDFRTECRELVQLLHGASILDPGVRPAGFVEPPLLQAARECARTGEPWHHHVMMPGCVLSPSPRMHVITLERGSTRRIETLISETAPDDAQREIELLYFASARCPN